MIGLHPNDVRLFLQDYLSKKLQEQDRGMCENLPEDCDLFLSGMVDSLGLLNLYSAIEEFTGHKIDFELLDPEEMTIVGPLCEFVSQQTRK
jgi:acyl carrier protein